VSRRIAAEARRSNVASWTQDAAAALGRYYYRNVATGVTQWAPPREFGGSEWGEVLLPCGRLCFADRGARLVSDDVGVMKPVTLPACVTALLAQLSNSYLFASDK
jgi:hypothetical protein